MNLKEYILSKPNNRPVYMPYLTVGDPSFDDTAKFAIAMIDAGADVLELGIPFSDPTADGPVIQAAMVRALNHPDFSLEKVFSVVEEIHTARPNVPIVFLTYMNPVLTGFLHQVPGNPQVREEFNARENIQNFLEHCQKAGVKGLVIPDLPYDQPESIMLREMGESFGVDQVMLIAPNTRKDRFKEVCKLSRGFIYYVTSMGVTGERKELPKDLKDKVKKIQKASGLPVMAGFGFNDPEQVKPLKGIIDGVIVGSMNHRIISEKGGAAGDELAASVSGFTKALL